MFRQVWPPRGLMQYRLKVGSENYTPNFDVMLFRRQMKLIEVLRHRFSVNLNVIKASRRIELQVVSPLVQNVRG